MKKIVNFLTLFSSVGTLLCCALPVTLVALGAGSVMASLVVNVPGLIWISVNKIAVFIFAGLMLLVSSYVQSQSKFRACPVDEELNNVCKETKDWSKIILQVSISIYFIGGFFAFIAPKLI